MPYQKEGREANLSYLSHIRRQPCCICGDDVHVEAHHPRYGVGMQDKANDLDVVPLCGRHHRELHATGSEREWWAGYGIDPQALALRYQILAR